MLTNKDKHINNCSLFTGYYQAVHIAFASDNDLCVSSTSDVSLYTVYHWTPYLNRTLLR